MNQRVGVGDAYSDAQTQLSTLQTALTTVLTGGTLDAQSTANVNTALQALQTDVAQLNTAALTNTSPQTAQGAPSTKNGVTPSGMIFIAAGAALAGAVAVWLFTSLDSPLASRAGEAREENPKPKRKRKK